MNPISTYFNICAKCLSNMITSSWHVSTSTTRSSDASDKIVMIDVFHYAFDNFDFVCSLFLNVILYNYVRE